MRGAARLALVLAMVVASLLVLAGCAGRGGGTAPRSVSPTLASPTPSPTPTQQPTATATPERPDPVALWEAWRAKPRYDQVIAGIHVGPTVEERDSLCTSGEARYADPSTAQETPLAIMFTYMSPRIPGAAPPREPQEEAVACGDRLVWHTAMAGHQAPAAAGLEQGGFILVTRHQLGPDDPPAVRSDVPAENWYAATVAGRPAAVGRPVHDAGLGSTLVVVWDDAIRVVTAVQALNLSVVETLKVAEGLFQ